MELSILDEGKWEMVPVSARHNGNRKRYVALHHLFDDAPTASENYSHPILRLAIFGDGNARKIQNGMISRFPHFKIKHYYDADLEVNSIDLANLKDPKQGVKKVKKSMKALQKKVNDLGDREDDLLKQLDEIEACQIKKYKAARELKREEHCLKELEEIEASTKAKKKELEEQLNEQKEKVEKLRKERDDANDALKNLLPTKEPLEYELKSVQEQLTRARKEQDSREIQLAEPIAYGVMPMDDPEILVPCPPVPVLALRYSGEDERYAFYVLADTTVMPVDKAPAKKKAEMYEGEEEWEEEEEEEEEAAEEN